jgi:hypothetical protein
MTLQVVIDLGRNAAAAFRRRRRALFCSFAGWVAAKRKPIDIDERKMGSRFAMNPSYFSLVQSGEDSERD